MKPKSIRSLIGSVVLLAVIVLAFYFHQAIIDQVTVWGYRPSVAVSALAARDDLSAEGKFLFYASRPAIETRQDFNKACGDHELSKAILGCYDGRNIYIFDVTNKELDGIKEVTAAHELLHAAYQRLSSSERANVDNLLKQELQKLSSDKTFQARIQVYGDLSPAVYLDEMHSVIGTEIASVGSALENHYQRYFLDRAQIVTLHSQYSTVFSKLQSDSTQLVTKLNNLATAINTKTTSYNAAATELSADIEAFNSRAKVKGGFATKSDFDQARQALLNRVSNLTTERKQLEAMISEYQSGTKELEAMQAHLQSLDNSIDSNLQPVPEVSGDD